MFRQKPDHTFEEANALWGITLDHNRTWSVLVADFDNDGDNDIYYVNGNFPGERNTLWRNDLNTQGSFTNVTNQSGDAGLPLRGFGATALDYDRDGLLDFFMSNITAADRNYLFHNEGGLVFTEVGATAGITHNGQSRHCSAGDIDNDGWDDIAVGHWDTSNLLYHNQRDGTFKEIAERAGCGSPGRNFGCVLEDFNNDGWVDIYAAKYHFRFTQPSRLYLNEGDGTFLDVTAGSGTTGQTDMGHNTGDLDADGYPDIYIGTGTRSTRSRTRCGWCGRMPRVDSR